MFEGFFGNTGNNRQLASSKSLRISRIYVPVGVSLDAWCNHVVGSMRRSGFGESCLAGASLFGVGAVNLLMQQAAVWFRYSDAASFLAVWCKISVSLSAAGSSSGWL